MNNITFNFKKEPIQKKSKGSYLIWGFLGLFLLGVFVLSCGSDNPVSTEIPEHEHTVAPEKRPLTQLLNMTQADSLQNLNIVGDSVVTFQTKTALFRYAGTTNSLISVIRGVKVFYAKQTAEGIINTEIGSSAGIIVNLTGVEVTTLEPDQIYYYLSEWNNDPFSITNTDGGVAVYTNFYVLFDGSDSSSLSKYSRKLNILTGKPFFN